MPPLVLPDKPLAGATITVELPKGYKFRLRVGLLFIRLACLVMGCGLEVGPLEAE